MSAYTYLWRDSPQMLHADPLSENHEDQFAGSQETARSRTSSPSPVRALISESTCVFAAAARLSSSSAKRPLRAAQLALNQLPLSIRRREHRILRSESCPRGGRRSGPSAGSGRLGEKFFDRLGLQHTQAQFFELCSRAFDKPVFSPLWYGAEPLFDLTPQ